MRWSLRPFTPPFALAAAKATSMPVFIARPSSLAGPVRAALIPKLRSGRGCWTAADAGATGAVSSRPRYQKNPAAATASTTSPATMGITGERRGGGCGGLGDGALVARGGGRREVELVGLAGGGVTDGRIPAGVGISADSSTWIAASSSTCVHGAKMLR